MYQLLILKLTGLSVAQAKGDIIELREDSSFGGLEPDTFVMVQCEDPFPSNYSDAWRLAIDYEVVNNNPSIDGWRIRLFSTLVDSTNKGAVTKDQVERFINEWGGTVFSFGNNEVIFDALIYDAICSEGFWDKGVASVDFTEISYVQATGIHTVEADYSSLNCNPDKVEDMVEFRGGTVLSHVDKVITFEIHRSSVRNAFQDDIKTNAKKAEMIEKRRYYINSGVVDYVIGQGGTYTTDLPTILGYIHDKVDN